MKIILVEDEIRMADAIEEILKQEAYEVDVFHDGLCGMEQLMCNRYDVAVLDIMLPGMNGLEIVKKIRQEKIATPILLLSAKGEIDDKVLGLDCGANDYLTKPFEVKELLARIRALGRRNIAQSDNSIEAGDLTLRCDTLFLSSKLSGEEIRLSDKEYKIIEAFMVNYGKILTREMLALRVWGYDNEAEYNNVEVYISFTRKKLSFIETTMEIKSVRGIGYELKEKNV